MILRALQLRSFRAHIDTSVSFAPKINLIYGPNGAGKTNLLEAIHYVCLSKSFLASNDRYALRQDARFFEVDAQFEGVQRPQLHARLAYMPSEGKQIFVNGAPLERLSDIVGMLPLVIFSPQDQAITAEGPSERRRFLNNVLSQGHRVYLDELMQYRRALRQRSELLKQFRRRRAGGSHEAVLESWNKELIALGAAVIARRMRFLEIFSDHLAAAYARVHQVAELPTVAYDTIADLPPDASRDRIEEAFAEEIGRVSQRERERGTTLVGPQRDELIFRLDGLEVRRYASQGQHRTFGMALKLAQYFYLQEQLEEPPVLLLDDVFDNLDRHRIEAFIDLLKEDLVGQSIITAAAPQLFSGLLPQDEAGYSRMRVANGSVTP